MIGPSAETLVRMGAKETFLIVNENEAWRLVSPMILHAGLIHYFLNMLALWFIGSAVEQSHGLIPTMILFILPAIGGTVLSAIFLPEYISVGASGGIFGLIGACLSDIVMNWKLIFSDFVNERGSKKRHAMILLFLFLDIVVNCLLGEYMQRARMEEGYECLCDRSLTPLAPTSLRTLFNERHYAFY